MWTTTHIAKLLPQAAEVPPPHNSHTHQDEWTANPAMNMMFTQLLEVQMRRDEMEARRQEELLAGPKPKQMDELTLCTLLGWCGLAWHECDFLPQIWIKLEQGANKQAKYMLLQAEFQKLAKTVPAFQNFENRQLFDHLIELGLAPGATELAFIPLSALDVHLEMVEYDIFDQAMHTTTSEWHDLRRGSTATTNELLGYYQGTDHARGIPQELLHSAMQCMG